MVWLAGINDGDDELITVSLDMVTEHTTVSVGVVGHIAGGPSPTPILDNPDINGGQKYKKGMCT